jgi:hypothetical protein
MFLCILHAQQLYFRCPRYPAQLLLLLVLLLLCRLILETDPQTVASRVTMRGADGEVPITEQVSTWLQQTCCTPLP